MSHHLDSPASRQDPCLNLTDMYLFDGKTGTVLVMVVNTSLAGAARIPGFHPEGRYEFKVHLDNEEYENLAYRFVFGGSDGDAVQSVALYQLTGADAHNDGAPGTLIARGCTGEVINGPGGSGASVGRAAADPFYLDLRQLADIIEGLQNNKPIEFGEWTVSQASAASQACRSARLSSRSPGQTRSCARDATSACGVPSSWPPTREAGVRSTGPPYP